MCRVQDLPTLSELFGIRSGLALRVCSYGLPHGGLVERTLLLGLEQSKNGVRVHTSAFSDQISRQYALAMHTATYIEKIKAVRKLKHLTQQEMADRPGF